MKTAGGIIALIAGIFGIIGAAITLLGCSFSGVFGWQGVTFSFIVIVLGAVALRVDRKMVGVLLIIIPLVGALLEYVLVDDSCGGPHQINAFVTGLGMMIVAVFMVLASIGGIFVTIGAGRKKSGNETVKVLIIVGLVFLDFCLILYIIGLTFGILSWEEIEREPTEIAAITELITEPTDTPTDTLEPEPQFLGDIVEEFGYN